MLVPPESRHLLELIVQLPCDGTFRHNSRFAPKTVTTLLLLHLRPPQVGKNDKKTDKHTEIVCVRNSVLCRKINIHTHNTCREIYIHTHNTERNIYAHTHNCIVGFPHTNTTILYCVCAILYCLYCWFPAHKHYIVHTTTRGGGLGSSTIFKKFHEIYAPS